MGSTRTVELRLILVLSWAACISGMTACGGGGAPNQDGGSSNPDGAPSNSGSPDAGPDGGLPSYFYPTGNMSTARSNHTATLLSNGKVLVAAGVGATDFSPPSALAGADLYDPGTGTFSATGSMSTARFGHTATLLSDSKVLVTGGHFLREFPHTEGDYDTAELYDADTGSFHATGSMSTARSNHTATLLSSGKVLVVGGRGATVTLASAELYDPETGTFRATGTMTAGRANHTATLLANGRVLIAGGYGGPGMVASAELYDPETGTFSPTGSMGTARARHSATTLSTGNVLVAGGGDGSDTLATAELYDLESGTFRVTGSMMVEARDSHSATKLSSGKVLVAGGINSCNDPCAHLASAELYDPETGTFSPTGSMGTARSFHAATLLSSGKVLLAGGYGIPGFADIDISLASAELFDEP